MDRTVEISREELGVFLAEAEEQIEALETGLLALESGAREPEMLGNLFRAAHTLKGSSATIGHREMARLTHAMETVLDGLRKDTLRLDLKSVDMMLRAVDALRAYREEIAGGKAPSMDADALATALESLTGEGAEEEGKAGADAPRGLRVEVRFEEDTVMPAVRAFQVLMALGELGDVIRSEPTLDEIEREQVRDRLTAYLRSSRSEEGIREVLGSISDVKDVHLEEVLLEGEASASPDTPDSPIRYISNTVRVNVNLFDNMLNLVGELVIDRSRLSQLVKRLSADLESDERVQELERTSSHIGRISAELQEEIMRARMLPVENLFKKFPRMVRDLARQGGKLVEFLMEGENTELDRAVMDEIADPLIHILRNAVDHGIEPPAERRRAGKREHGTVRLAACHEDNHIAITVEDDGRGIDAARLKDIAVEKGLLDEDAAGRLPDHEAVQLIYLSGLSTAEEVSQVSGRGVGMDVVLTNIHKVNGAIEVWTERGKGTRFTIRLPLTMAIIRGLLVEAGGTRYVIPLASVMEAVRLEGSSLQRVNGMDALILRGKVLPLVELSGALDGRDAPSGRKAGYVVVVRTGGTELGLLVDKLVREQEVVVKSLGGYLGNVSGVFGATILGEGELCLIIDVASLMKRYVASRAS